MPKVIPPRQQFMAEILELWATSAVPLLEGKLAMAMDELLQEADRLLRQGAFLEAQAVCEYVSNLVTSDWEAWPRLKMDYALAQGAAAFYLGSIFTAKGEVQAGLEQYRASIDCFTVRKAWLTCAAIWYTCGRIESENCSWKSALSDFQYALNTLDMAEPRPPQADALEAEIRVEFDYAKDRWMEELQAAGTHYGRPEAIPAQGPGDGKPATVPVEEAKGETRDRREPSPGASPTSPASVAAHQLHDIVEIPIIRDLAAGPPRSLEVPASQAELMDDDLLDVISLDENHARGIDFGFRVRGKSMIDAGILDGDFVLVRRPGGAMPEDGQIVAVAIHGLGEDSATLKKFYNRGDHSELRPMNSSEPHIVVIPQGANREPIEDWYNEHEIPALFLVGNEVEVARVIGVWRRV